MSIGPGCVFFSQITRRVNQLAVFNFQTECEDPEKLIEVSDGIYQTGFGLTGLTGELRVGR